MKKIFATLLLPLLIVVLLAISCTTPTQTSTPTSTPETTPTSPEPSQTPEPTPTPTPSPTPTPEPTVSTDWWWVFPWGDDYEATPGTRINLEKRDEITAEGKPYPAITYALEAIGLPQDEVYYLWVAGLKYDEPMQIATELSINDEGYAVNAETGEEMILVAADFLKGEPMEVALMTEDKTIIAFGKIIPHPIESEQGPYRIWVELATPDGDLFMVWGEGFEPDEEINITLTSDGEVAESTEEANSNGQFGLLLDPRVFGEEAGLVTFTATGKAVEVTVSFEWGTSD